MKLVDGWWWPDGEQHMIEWMADAKNRVIMHGRSSYQGRKIQHALNLAMQHDRIGVAIDIGAHIGLWAYNLAQVFESLDCFEPVAAHRECFELNVLGTDVSVRARSIELHPCALGDREGSVNIWSNPTSSGDSWVKGDGTIPMRTLDSFRLARADFIKVDAEGYEELILRGAEILIGTWHPIIVVEQKRDFATKFGLEPQGAVEYLRKTHGYKVESVMAGDFFMVHE